MTRKTIIEGVEKHEKESPTNLSRKRSFLI